MESHNEDDTKAFREKTDEDAEVHIVGGERARIAADVGFVEGFVEVVVGATEAAVKEGC